MATPDSSRENTVIMRFIYQVDAYKKSFRINEIRFNKGVSNSVAYIISKNNMDTAQINLANVNYEYALLVRILE